MIAVASYHAPHVSSMSHGYWSEHSMPMNEQRAQTPIISQKLADDYRTSIHSTTTASVDTPRSNSAALQRATEHTSLAPYGVQESSFQRYTHAPSLKSTFGAAPRHLSNNSLHYWPHQTVYTPASGQNVYTDIRSPQIPTATTDATGACMPALYTALQSDPPLPVQPPQHADSRTYNYGWSYQHSPNSNYMHNAGSPQQPLSSPAGYGMLGLPPMSQLSQHASRTQVSSPGSGPTQSQMAMPPPIPYSSINKRPASSPLSVPSTPSQPRPSDGQREPAPGPVPATKPLEIWHDSNGVQWIKFEYSFHKEIFDYEIRCDIESVDLKKLPIHHKEGNCIYSKALVQETYQGNRFAYESRCNEVAWALTWLNPELIGKKGLQQRAVDSWRNSRTETFSRRVRRGHKDRKRKELQRQLQVAKQRHTVPTSTNGQGPSATATGMSQLETPGNAVHQYYTSSQSEALREGVNVTGLGKSSTELPPDVRHAQSFSPMHPPRQAHFVAGPPASDTMQAAQRHPPPSATTLLA